MVEKETDAQEPKPVPETLLDTVRDPDQRDDPSQSVRDEGEPEGENFV